MLLNRYKYDIVAILDSLSGFRVALEISKQNFKIALLLKLHPLCSHTGAAQGSIMQNS